MYIHTYVPTPIYTFVCTYMYKLFCTIHCTPSMTPYMTLAQESTSFTQIRTLHYRRVCTYVCMYIRTYIHTYVRTYKRTQRMATAAAVPFLVSLCAFSNYRLCYARPTGPQTSTCWFVDTYKSCTYFFFISLLLLVQSLLQLKKMNSVTIRKH